MSQEQKKPTRETADLLTSALSAFIAMDRFVESLRDAWPSTPNCYLVLQQFAVLRACVNELSAHKPTPPASPARRQDLPHTSGEGPSLVACG